MCSFYELYESRRSGGDFWYHPPKEGVGLEIIRRGLEVRADRTDGNTFWDDFISVLGQNPEDAAKLLGVSQDRVARWPQQVRKLLDAVREKNQGEEGRRKQKNMLQTGV